MWLSYTHNYYLLRGSLHMRCVAAEWMRAYQKELLKCFIGGWDWDVPVFDARKTLLKQHILYWLAFRSSLVVSLQHYKSITSTIFYFFIFIFFSPVFTVYFHVSLLLCKHSSHSQPVPFDNLSLSPENLSPILPFLQIMLISLEFSQF